MKTSSDNLSFAMALLLTLWVVFAGAYLCYINPEHPGRYLMAIAMMGLGWGVRQVFLNKAKNNPACAFAGRQLTSSIVLAGVILGLALLARLGWIDWLGDFGDRSRGFIAGAIVVFLSNTIPKQIGPARGQALRRTAGWTLVLGGMGYSLAWLLLPVIYANEVAVTVMLLAVAHVVLRIVLFARKQSPDQSSGTQ